MSVSGNYGKQNVDGGFLDGVQEPIQDVAQTADRICRGLETIEDGLEAAWGGVKSLFGFGGGEEVGQAGSAPAPSQVEEPAVGSGYADASLTTQLMALANKAGINADDIRKILDKGIGDYDNQGAGAELQQFKSWLAENKDKLSPAALQVAEAYVKLGDELAAKGKTGISDEKWNGMMEEVAAYKDPATTEETTPKETAGTELDKNMCLEDMIFELLMACLKDKREELRGLAEDAK